MPQFTAFKFNRPFSSFTVSDWTIHEYENHPFALCCVGELAYFHQNKQKKQ